MTQWLMIVRATLRLGGCFVLLCAIAACAPTPTSTRAQSSTPPPSPAPSANPQENTAAELTCDAPQTQLAMNQCAHQAYQQADATLNQTYQQLHGQLSTSGQQNLTDAELAWINFRDAECEFAKNKYEGGSIAPLIYNGCLESLTTLRTTEIEAPQLPQISYEMADTQLNDVYQILLRQLRETRAQAFVSSQLAWIEYRDRHCAFEVLYGSTPIEESQCLARMSETRTEQILETIEDNNL